MPLLPAAPARRPQSAQCHQGRPSAAAPRSAGLAPTVCPPQPRPAPRHCSLPRRPSGHGLPNAAAPRRADLARAVCPTPPLLAPVAHPSPAATSQAPRHLACGRPSNAASCLCAARRSQLLARGRSLRMAGLAAPLLLARGWSGGVRAWPPWNRRSLALHLPHRAGVGRTARRRSRPWC